MKETFREYHRFDQSGIEELWKTALFVFDANTLLNMYRYSRDTVDEFLGVLAELKKKDRIWIPYQVGLEFYENRLDVIGEYEGSYDAMLKMLEKAKSDIANKYKNHPFLDLSAISKEISKGLSGAESQIKQAKKAHPKWAKNDEMLNRINDLFENATGKKYSEVELNNLYKLGEGRYKNNIPPGYRDAKKTDNRKYGDLILWMQIIDHAQTVKKPIIFISGDIKEDWWLIKNNERIQPRPELKREMLDKADVDFHIYTADRFLEFYQSGGDKVDSEAIKEVRKIREIEENRLDKITSEQSIHDKIRSFNTTHQTSYFERITILDAAHDIEMIIQTNKIHPGISEDIMRVVIKLRELLELRGAGMYAYYERDKIIALSRELLYLIDRAISRSKDRMNAETAHDLMSLALRIAKVINDIN